MDKSNYISASVQLIKDWAIWVTGIQTGAIAILGSLVKDGVPKVPLRWAMAALISFVFSIISAVWLVLLLPSVMARAAQADDQGIKGIYDMSLYERLNIRLGTLATMMEFSFMIGIVCLAMFVYKRAAQPIEKRL